jgi:ATP-dependent Lon protease
MKEQLDSLEEIIGRLCVKRDEKKLSLRKLIRLIEDNGDIPPSISTLSRLFSGDSDARFSYEDTIRPVAKVLLDFETIEETDTDDEKTLKSLLKLKMTRINELESELAQLESKYRNKLDKERERYNKSIDFLKEQVAYKDKRMDVLLDAVRKKDELHNKLLEQILSCPCRKKNEN